MSNEKQINPDVFMGELLRLYDDPSTSDVIKSYLDKNLWKPLQKQPYGIGGKKSGFFNKQQGKNYVDLDSLKQIVNDVNYLLKNPMNKEIETNLKEEKKKEKKEKKEKSDTFKYIVPKNMIAEKYLNHLSNTAGDTLYFNKTEMNELEGLMNRKFTGDKFALKSQDKKDYNNALINFKDNIENELWDDIDIPKNTLISIRPEIKDSLNLAIEQVKNKKKPTHWFWKKLGYE